MIDRAAPCHACMKAYPWKYFLFWLHCPQANQLGWSVHSLRFWFQHSLSIFFFMLAENICIAQHENNTIQLTAPAGYCQWGTYAIWQTMMICVMYMYALCWCSLCVQLGCDTIDRFTVCLPGWLARERCTWQWQVQVDYTDKSTNAYKIDCHRFFASD